MGKKRKFLPSAGPTAKKGYGAENVSKNRLSEKAQLHAQHQREQVLNKHRVPFRKTDNILLIGEGVPVSGDPRIPNNKQELDEKYPDAEHHVNAITKHSAHVLYSVDARRLDKTKAIRTRTWDNIIWNFPHAGSGMKDQDRAVLQNQRLLLDFFQSSLSYLSGKGVIVVTLAEGKPYDLWNIKALAKSKGLECPESFRFNRSTFPGYSHRRTIGYKEALMDSSWKGEERNARVYCFVRKGTKFSPELSDPNQADHSEARIKDDNIPRPNGHASKREAMESSDSSDE